MVLDFSFLKRFMMEEIDEPCDHGCILQSTDPLLDRLMHGIVGNLEKLPARALSPLGKFYIVPFAPTAENLARHWYEKISPRVLTATSNQAMLVRVRVFETPNCWADYPSP